MRKFYIAILIIASPAILLPVILPVSSPAQPIPVTDIEAEWIGNIIFLNECGGDDRRLISWNDGEDFASLGIGHFIWYPEGRKGRYDESFPALAAFIKERGGALPDWLREPMITPCPWQSRKELLRDLDGPKAAELRRFLMNTRDLQLVFIINRLNGALSKMLSYAPEGAGPHIERQFRRLASIPAGRLALADYVNFKGEGVSASERYNGQGWGLLQVLERMKDTEGAPDAVREFVRSAREVLTERVNNSPPERDEERWLRGWKRRLDTYAGAMDDFPS